MLFLNIDIRIIDMFQTERNDSDFSHNHRCEIGLSIVRKQFEIFLAYTVYYYTTVNCQHVML